MNSLEILGESLGSSFAILWQKNMFSNNTSKPEHLKEKRVDRDC